MGKEEEKFFDFRVAVFLTGGTRKGGIASERRRKGPTLGTGVQKFRVFPPPLFFSSSCNMRHSCLIFAHDRIRTGKFEPPIELGPLLFTHIFGALLLLFVRRGCLKKPAKHYKNLLRSVPALPFKFRNFLEQIRVQVTRLEEKISSLYFHGKTYKEKVTELCLFRKRRSVQQGGG